MLCDYSYVILWTGPAAPSLPLQTLHAMAAFINRPGPPSLSPRPEGDSFPNSIFSRDEFVIFLISSIESWRQKFSFKWILGHPNSFSMIRMIILMFSVQWEHSKKEKQWLGTCVCCSLSVYLIDAYHLCLLKAVDYLPAISTWKRKVANASKAIQ